MKQKKSIYIITVLVIVFSVICCVMPFFTKSELTEKTVISMFGETVELYGKGLYLIASGVLIFLMWIGRIVPTIGKDIAPVGLDNCTTAVIQAMDLGIIVPACFVIAYLLKIKHKLGYILGPVIIVKAVTLVTAVMAMAICMKISGVEVDMASFFVFGPICIASYIYFFLVMKKIKNLERL